jgi:hypothetical protein
MNLEMISARYQRELTRRGLPQHSADELLHEDLSADNRAYVSQFLREFEAAESAGELGFDEELAGGGDIVLTRYLDSGAFVMATKAEGSGMPTADDFCVCAYPPGFDGDYSALPYQMRSTYPELDGSLDPLNLGAFTRTLKNALSVLGV